MTQEHEPIKLNESTSEPKENGIYLLAITFNPETKTMPLYKDGNEYLGADSSYSWGELVKELSTADEATIQSLSDHDAQIRAGARHIFLLDSETKAFATAMFEELEEYGFFDYRAEDKEEAFEIAFESESEGQYGFDAVEAGIKAVNQLRETPNEEQES
ncbi:hypothetical protein [Bifidobacterium crudilactis]|jgi:hypothetical protein|uniref:hypothetical protein n=1 Tax=Bifidobacterium crudilactis TaxID=327277 RepID=UPI002F352529